MEGSNPSLLSPGLWSPSACAASSEAMQTELAQLPMTLEITVAPWSQAEMYAIRKGGEHRGNKKFQRALLPLSLVTVDSFTVINSLTSSFCDKWGRTDWIWWLIYQWIASFPFKPRPHWWSLWFSSTSWEGLQPDTCLAVVTSPPRNSVWDAVCSFNRPGGNRVFASVSPPHKLCMRKRNLLLLNLLLKWQ